MDKYRGLIVCGFPGVGKSTAANNRSDIDDAESSAFGWIFDPEDPVKPRKRNPEFPANYVNHIENVSSRYGYPIVLVSSHKEVREELDKKGIPYIIVIPRKDAKEEYLRRYIARGSGAEFVCLISQMWDKWIDEIEGDKEHAVIHLEAGEYLDAILPK